MIVHLKNLDETLVHSSDKPANNSKEAEKKEKKEKTKKMADYINIYLS